MKIEIRISMATANFIASMALDQNAASLEDGRMASGAWNRFGLIAAQARFDARAWASGHYRA